MLARSFYKEVAAYGFQLEDVLRFVNILLDTAMKSDGAPRSEKETSGLPRPNGPVRLPLTGEKVLIRALDRSGDRALLGRWLSDRVGRHFLLSRSTARPLDIDDLLNHPCNVIGVITLPDQTPAGLIAFLDYDHVQHKAELRKLIGEPHLRGRGLAKEATRLWIRYGVSCLAVRKIFLNTLENNLRNIRLNEELGFHVEGVLRNEVFFDGAYHDVLRMGLWVE